MADTFYISDTHFFDERIIQIEQRPFRNADEMNVFIVKQWNNTVGKNDTVVVLGDYSVGSRTEIENITHQLNGFKHLIIGNHDRTSERFWIEVGFKSASRVPIIRNKHFICSHTPPEFIKSPSYYSYFFGHVHNTGLYPTITSNTACLCVERWNYKPQRESRLITLMKEYKSSDIIYGK